MRKLFVLIAVIAVVACQKETPAPAKKDVRVQTKTIPSDASNANVKKTLPIDVPVLERSALGTKLDKDGNVFESAETFTPGEPIYLSMWLKQSPVGLQTSLRVVDAKGKDVDWPKREMKGEKVVTFKVGKPLTPGQYHAQCFWGMNQECDYTFTVEGAAKKKH